MMIILIGGECIQLEKPPYVTGREGKVNLGEEWEWRKEQLPQILILRVCPVGSTEAPSSDILQRTAV